jgi:hypothetical protein
MEKITKFIALQLDQNKRTSFHEEMKVMIDSLKDNEIVDLFEQSEYIDYNRFSIMPIIYPLCVYYKRHQSIKWLTQKIDYGNCSSKPVLLSNLMKLDLPLSVPEKWKSHKNLLPYICDDLDVTERYIGLNPNSVNDVMKSNDECLNIATLEVLRYMDGGQLIGGYSNVKVMEKFVDLCDVGQMGKLKYIISTRKISVDEMILLCKNNKMCHQMLEQIANAIDEDDRKRFLKTVIGIIDKNIHYSELDDEYEIECVFYSAMMLNIKKNDLPNILSIDRTDNEMINDYKEDYIGFINRYTKTG